MAAIGFRCLPRGFAYVVLDGTQEEPQALAKDKLSFPEDSGRCEQLAWLRKQVLEVLREHRVDSAGIKAAEHKARSKSLQRSEVEGVVKEAVYSDLGSECVARIKSQLRRDIVAFTEPARYLDKALKSRRLQEFTEPLYTDAALAALAELPAETE